jgi:hypothetical protein
LTEGFIHNLDPKYKLRVEENVVHDSFGRRGIRHSVSSPFEICHQVMVVVATCEAMLQPLKLVPGVHLGDGQGNRGPMIDAVKNNLPGAHRDVLDTVHQQVTPDVQSPNDVAHY